MPIMTTDIERENIYQLKKIKTIDDLLEEFQGNEQLQGEKLQFTGVENKDVYNSTTPFEYQGQQYIIARVESPDRDTDYRSVFFTKSEGKWSPVKDIPSLNLQDPFISKINDQFIIGGVEVYSQPLDEYPDNLNYATSFFQGRDLNKLEKFFQGPERMKDLRIIRLANGKIGVFTRPGDIFTRSEDKIGGMIAYTEVDSLKDLKIENINKAEIIENLFNTTEWGGANALYLLENDQIGVIGHIARINSAGEKEYYALSLEFDPKQRQFSHKKIITTRDNFPEGKTKNIKYGDNRSADYLKHIIFPGGIKIKNNNETYLYAGLSDSEEGKIRIDYPFSSPIKKNIS